MSLGSCLQSIVMKLLIPLLLQHHPGTGSLVLFVIIFTNPYFLDPLCFIREQQRYGAGNETPMHPSRTPMHPYMTPMRDSGG